MSLTRKPLLKRSNPEHNALQINAPVSLTWQTWLHKMPKLYNQNMRKENENWTMKYPAQTCCFYLEHFKNQEKMAHLSFKRKKKSFLSVIRHREPAEEQVLGRKHSLWEQLLCTSWGRRLHKLPDLTVLQWTETFVLSPWITNARVFIKYSSLAGTARTLASWLCYGQS